MSSRCKPYEIEIVLPSLTADNKQHLRRHSTSLASPHPRTRPLVVHNGTPARKRSRCPRKATVLMALVIMLGIWVVYGWRVQVVPLTNLEVERLPLMTSNATRAPVFVKPATINFQSQYPVALIMPLVGHPIEARSAKELFGELLRPLLQSEAALCYRATDGAAVHAAVHAVVVTRVAASVVQAALGATVVATWPADGVAVGVGGAGGALTPGARWRTWEVDVAAARSALQLARADGSDAAARCLGDVVTVVAPAVEGRGAIFSKEPADTLEVLVDAGLRTRGGAAGTHFIVLPSFLGASRMAYVEPGDAAEERRAGTGLVDALLRTATTRNGGRVAAAQCTILGIRNAMGSPSPRSTGGVPDSLTLHDLRGLQVLDKGAIVGATHQYMMLLPFLARRFSEYLATDQRASWEEVVDAVTLHCGIFNRDLYNAVGGFASALADPAVQHVSNRVSDHLLAAPDRSGWVLSLRMQELYPDWQVWSSRGVAVLRDDPREGDRTSNIVKHLFFTFYSIRDEYGKRMSSVLAGLQRRRVGQSWTARQTSLRPWNSTAIPPHFPAVIVYGTDFAEPCCGLNREAMGYIRPLIERYAIHTRGVTQVCAKPGDALLDAAYHTRSYERVLSHLVATQLGDPYWRGELQRRAHVDFFHMRPTAITGTHYKKQNGVVNVKVTRSLSELSNIPAKWVKPLQTKADEIWATADFFAAIYRRNGIDPAKVRVVPEAVDVYDFDPANYERQPVTVDSKDERSFDNQPELTPEERIRRYVFFANFKWEDRKGWDVLLGAYWDAFGPAAPPEMRNRTTLVIKTKFEDTFTRGVTMDHLVEFIEGWGRLGSLDGMTSIRDFPHIVVLSASLTTPQLTQLYADADAFVFPSKAEGWGLPATEAMSMGLPVLITEWGGLRRFITPDTCFRIPLDGLEEIDPGSPYGYAKGMKMAMPSRAKTAELMQYVLRHPEHARRVGRRARALMMREISEEAVADMMDQLLLEAVRRRMSREASTSIAAVERNHF